LKAEIMSIIPKTMQKLQGKKVVDIHVK